MIGIFLIATGKYIKYSYSLCDEIQKFFLPDKKKTVYLFTDSDEVPSCVEKVYQEHKPFPYPTLMRYHIITDFCARNNISHKYYYYLDVDMKIVDTVGDEVLGKLVLTRHPGFYHKRTKHFELETKFLSRAYTPHRTAKFYYCGGFNGGADYLKMANTIRGWVDVDQKYGHVPMWHDECYLNAYANKHEPGVILSPSYCYPDVNIDIKKYGLQDLKPKILAVTKH